MPFDVMEEDVFFEREIEEERAPRDACCGSGIGHRGGRCVDDRILAVTEFGDLHALADNATIEVREELDRLMEAEFDDVIAVKLKGIFAVARWAATYRRGRFEAGDRIDGVIVNTASCSGLLDPLPT